MPVADRTTPFDEFERMLDRMSRQIEEATRMWSGAPTGGLMERSAMNVDVADHGDEFEVTADLPGFETDDIDIRIADRTLHVRAAHGEAAEESDERYLRQERRRRSISRSISLPEAVDEEAASATYTNGVLTVRIPKAGGEQGRSIDIG